MATDVSTGLREARMPSSRRTRYLLFLLLAINILNFVDRQIINILAEPIKRDLQLADWQLGMLTGLAFAVFYTALGIPIARLAEHANRRRIIAACVATWSAFTSLCGTAQTFTLLLVARMGVASGEAGCTPAAHSLISDYVPPARRASAIALFAMGTPIGSVLGLTLGGIVAGTLGWRGAFLLVGLPGLLLALLALLTLHEPRQMRGSTTNQERESWRVAWAQLRASRPFWLLALGVAATGIVGYGGGNFLPSFFLRNHEAELTALADAVGMPMIAFFGLALGLTAGTAGVFGTWLGGYLADRHGSRHPAAYAYIPAIAALFAYPLWVVAVLVPSAVAAIFLFGLANVAITIWPGPVFAGIHSLVSPRARATASAVTLLLVNLIGLGLGPLTLGLMSDGFAASGMGEGEGLRWAQVCITVAGFASGLLFFAAGRAMRAGSPGTS